MTETPQERGRTQLTGPGEIFDLQTPRRGDEPRNLVLQHHCPSADPARAGMNPPDERQCTCPVHHKPRAAGMNRARTHRLPDRRPGRSSANPAKAGMDLSHSPRKKGFARKPRGCGDEPFCYKKHKAYQPFTTYWAEADLVVHTEFRDGNVPAGHRQLRMLRESLEQLPSGVERVLLRSDTAGYQHELLRYCAEGRDRHLGVIGFAVGVDVTPEFKKTVSQVGEDEWQDLHREADRCA